MNKPEPDLLKMLHSYIFHLMKKDNPHIKEEILEKHAGIGAIETIRLIQNLIDDRMMKMKFLLKKEFLYKDMIDDE